MKAPCDSLLKAFRMHGSWITVLLLCQCSMPPRQAWHYIQRNGLFTYLNYEATRPSPPFGAGVNYSQRYASRSGSPYGVPRYSQRPSSYWSSYADSGAPYRVPYRPAPSYPSRYFAEPAPRIVQTPPPSRERAPRPTPRVRPEPPAARPSPPRMPVDEPPAPPPPAVVRNEPQAPPSRPTPAPTPKINGTPPPAAPAGVADLPFGTPVPGRPNMVNSPFAGKTQLVDVSGMVVGQTVKCPYTGKLFKVPPSQQAANEAEPRIESKIDSPKMSSEPKADDKKP